MNLRHQLLNSETADAQVLETDVMRFMAIIGIVFWIVFAMVKTIPFKNEQKDSLEQASPNVSQAANANQQSHASLLQKEIAQLEKRKKTLENDIVEYARQRQSLAEQNNLAEEKLTSLTGELKALEKMRQHKKHLAGQLDNLQSEISNAAAIFKELEKEKNELTQEMSALKEMSRQKEQLTENIDNLQEQLLETENEHQRLLNAKRHLNNEVTLLQDALDRKEQLEAELTMLKVSVEANLAKQHQLDEVRAKAEKSLSDISRKTEKTKQELAKLKKQASGNTQPARKKTASRPSLTISFKSVEDIRELIKARAVSIWIDVRSDAFQLLYQAETVNGEIHFATREKANLPSPLWKIVGGGTYYHIFVDQLKNDHSITNSFTAKDVYIHFHDSSLESQVEKMFNSARSQKRFGNIQINSNREVQFDEHN